MKKLHFQTSIGIVFLFLLILTGCKKQSPPSPADGGKTRLSKVFLNGKLVSEYVYNETGRLRQVIFFNGFDSTKTSSVDFEYDEKDRIKVYRGSLLNVLNSKRKVEIIYNGLGEIEKEIYKDTITNTNNNIYVEDHYDLTYESVPNGRREITVLKTSPGFPNRVLEKTVYSVHNSGPLFGNIAEVHEYENATPSSPGMIRYSRYYRYSTDSPTNADINAANPYTYAATYGWGIIKRSPNVPITEILVDRASNGETYYTTHRYMLDANNLIIEDKEHEQYGSDPIWTYHYIEVR